MTPHMKSILCSAVLGIVVIGCDSTFSPKGPYEPKLVVYSVLSPHGDQQFVRLGVTYDVEGFDPAVHSTEEMIRGATVNMVHDGQTFVFRDTLIRRADSSRYSSPIGAYVAQPFRLVPGSRVQLSVVTQSFGTLTAETNVPGRGFISLTNSYVLRQVSSFESKIVVLLQIAPQARGYLLRYYIVYEVFKNGTWVLERRQFPLSAISFAGRNEFVLIFPKLERRSAEAFQQTLQPETVAIDQLAYQITLESILNEYSVSDLKFRHVVFELIQVDAHLYSYFNIVNGFQDEYSIRTDLPDYSNIRGGVGVVGAYMVDSLRVPLPERF